MVRGAVVAACLTLASWLLAGSEAFRQKRRSSEAASSAQTGREGEVDGIWALGSPGSAEPGLRNPRAADGCFPGARMWTASEGLLIPHADLATTCMGPLGFRHPRMKGIQAWVDEGKVEALPCSEELPNLPRGFPEIMHALSLYVEFANKVGDPLLSNVSNIGVVTSQISDATEARQVIESYGWSLVATAYHDGNLLIGGPQHCHLIQHPSSKVCMLTFQGTSSTEDWVSNMEVSKVKFCGIAERVHKGFRDHLRRIIWTDDWQNRIRTRLPSCSQVHVTGHSLGGAMAELFGACIAKAPEPGASGYQKDYEYMGWTK